MDHKPISKREKELNHIEIFKTGWFQCSVCGQYKPTAHLQQNHILRLKLNGSIVEFPICFECWVLAWCGRYEAFEKRHKLGYKSPPRIRDEAPKGGKVIGTFTDYKQWEMV